MKPFTFESPIETERLTLRLLRPDDLDDVFAWMSDPDVARYQLYEPRSREQVVEAIARSSVAVTLAEKGDFLQLAIVERSLGRVVGSIYFNLVDPENDTGEIGWALAAEFHGRGFATEAALAVLELGFREVALHRIYAELDPRNEASIRLCERLGMRHEAHFVEHMMFKGAWADTGIYGLLEREWFAR